MPKASYPERLKISIDGNTSTSFYTKTGLHVADGYLRVVLGGRGPYVEFAPAMIDLGSFFVPAVELWRQQSLAAFYDEWRSKDNAYIKLYWQKKLVDYADYRIGLIYISPFDLVVNGAPVIDPLKKTT